MQLALRWARDPKSYHVEPAKLPEKRGLVSVLSSVPEGPFITRNGQAPLAESDYYKVRFAKEPLYKRLAICADDDEGALDFVREFGFLGRADARREPVAMICDHIRAVRWLLDATKREDWSAVNDWLEKNRRLVDPRVVIGHDEDGRHQVRYQPVSLIGALYLQLLQDKSSGARYKRCKRPGCSTVFYYGPNTGRRETADYCGNTCRVKHFLEMQKEQAR